MNWGEFYRLSRCKIHFLVGVFGFAKDGVRHWKCGRQALWLILGMALVDNWVVGKEKVCYWLSDDIVGLVGDFWLVDNSQELIDNVRETFIYK